MDFQKENIYTIKDLYALPEGQRAEFIDGRMYMMTPPNRIHQTISVCLATAIQNYIDAKKGSCTVYAGPV